MNAPKKRRSSREPAVPATSPFAPVFDLVRSQIRGIAASIAADENGPDAEKLRCRIDGMENVLVIFQRAIAGEKIDTPHLVKLERPAEAAAPVDGRLAEIERRLTALEGRPAAPARALRAVPAILEPSKSRRAPAPRSTAKGPALLLLEIAKTEQRGATTEMLAVITGYKGTSRRTYLQQLTSEGRASRDGDRYYATPAGLASLGAAFKRLPNGRELRLLMLDTLPQGEVTVLGKVLAAYPHALSRQELALRTGYKATSIRTYVQKLSARELIETSALGVSPSLRLFDRSERASL